MALRTVVICDSPECDAVFDVGKRGPHSELTRAAHEAGWTSTSLNAVFTNLCDNHE